MNHAKILPVTAGLLLLTACGDDGVSADDSSSSGEASSGGADESTSNPDETGEPTTQPTSSESSGGSTGTTSEPGETGDSSGGDPANCLDQPDLCGAGTVCDPDSATCVADCSADEGVCGEGTVCADGMCKPDCSDGQVCGAGTVCGPQQACVLDCRANLLDVCAGEALCDRGTGLCQAVAAFDCAAAPGLCWEDQVCTASGYCKAAVVDETLAYDVQHYDLRLDLLTADQTFAAELAILIVATQDDTAELVLDVGAETLVEGEPYLPYEVTSVLDGDGAELGFVQDAAGTLTVTLGGPLAAGEETVVRVAYAGPFNKIVDEADPLFYTGIMQRAGKAGDLYVQTFGWPVYARRWLPSHDHPSDIATFSADVGIDNGFMVLSNGVPVRSEEVDGLNRTAFVLQQPVPTYAMHVIAADFEVVRLGVVDGVAIDAVVHAAETGLVHELWGGTVAALGYFNNVLGQYPFARYAMISVPGAFGGMEHATIVSLADTGVVANGAGSRRAAIHELSHHWFGDSAHQSDWPAFWLNESLASFMELEGLRVLGGPTLYRERLTTLKNGLFANPGTFADDALHYVDADAFPGEATNASLNAPYVKGPWLHHMLRVRLGDAAISAFLRALYEAHRFARYDTDSALAVLEASSGQEFDEFFAEWVYTPGWPQVQATWSYDAVEKKVALSVEQVQDIGLWGTYTLTGAHALRFVFDDADPMTAACEGVVEFPTGETLAELVIDCPQAPVGFTVPSLTDLLVELIP